MERRCNRFIHLIFTLQQVTIVNYFKMIVLHILIICLSILILKYVWSRRKLYRASRKLPGEIAYPLIGASWVFWNSSGIKVKFHLIVMVFDNETMI